MKATKQAKRDATQLFRACLVKGVLDETRVREVLRQIAAAKPRGYLDTLSYFRRLVQLDLDRHTAKIESASPLPAALQAGVKKDLEGIYGSGLQTFFVENPALIGGMRIKVGSDVYDGSIQARLAALERSF
jgi:F-type H+-transporting ATPase subunit delta